VSVSVGVSVGASVGVSVGIGVDVAVALENGVDVRLGVAVSDRVGVSVLVAVEVGVRLGDAVDVGTRVEVRVAILVAVRVGTGEFVRVAVAVGVFVRVRVAVRVAAGVGVMQRFSPGLYPLRRASICSATEPPAGAATAASSVRIVATIQLVVCFVMVAPWKYGQRSWLYGCVSLVSADWSPSNSASTSATKAISWVASWNRRARPEVMCSMRPGSGASGACGLANWTTKALSAGKRPRLSCVMPP